MEKIIHLNPDNYIGQGLHRKCYIYPNDNNKCIKINYNEGADTETNREIKYYQHLIKRNIIWDSLSQYYGEVKTNLGTGYVYDLIRDDDNQISQSLENYLKNPILTKKQIENLVVALKHLENSLYQNRIITMTIKSKNILYQQKLNNNRLIIIDNIGNSRFIKIDNYCAYFAKKSIKRKWERFIESLTKENAAVAARYYELSTNK